MNKIICFLLLLLSVVMSGCSSKSIFIDSEAKYRIEKVTSGEIDYEIYYIKDGSSFSPVYSPEKFGKGVYSIDKEKTLIPNYYKGELIAYKSKSLGSVPDSVNLTRVSDRGWSVGIYGVVKQNDGYFFDAKNCLIKDSDAYDALKKSDSKEITLLTINGKPVEEYELSPQGVILGFSCNEEILVTYLAGTMYKEKSLVCDQHIYLPMEDYYITGAEVTRNGYAALQMNEAAETGYYLLNGTGMFLYHAHTKGECLGESDITDISNYKTIYEKLAVMYQQQAIIVQAKTYNVEFKVSLGGAKDDDSVKCILMSPSGELYEFPYENGEAVITLLEVEAGRWTMNVYPKDIVINSVAVDSSISSPEAIYYSEEITIFSAYEQGIVTVRYTGKGDIWGNIVNVDTGESQELSGDKGTLSSIWYGMPAGTYRIDIYHYASTSVSSIDIYERTSGGESEIIIIDGDV